MENALDQARSLFLDWLATGEARDYCFQVAGAVFRDSFRDSAAASVFPYPVADVSGEMREVLQEDVTHDFLHFLLETFVEQVSTRPSLAQDILTGRPHLVISHGWNLFLKPWRESARNKEANPRGYLYRRLRELLKKAEEFRTIQFQRGWTAYAPADDVPEQERCCPADPETLRQCPAPRIPEGRTPEQEVFAPEFLLAAARAVHALVRAAHNHPCWVPVRDVVSYLAIHFSWLNRTVEDTLEDIEPPGQGEAVEERLDRISQLESIEVLAAQVVAEFSPDRCRVVLARFAYPEKSFRQIAEELGLASQNFANQEFNRALRRIERFRDEWPGPPWNELKEEVQDKFIHCVREYCKKRLDCP